MIKFIAGEINRSFLKSIIFIVIIINIGVSGYMYLEDFTLINALYMTFITITTVGFSEVMPLSDTGKIFTIVLICFSLGVIGYTLSIFGKYIVEGLLSNRLKDYKIFKRIERMKEHVIVVGFGRNGRQAITELIDHDEKVVVVDNDVERINSVKRLFPTISYVLGNATHDEALIKAGIKNAKAIITAIPKDADNLYVVLTARELNPSIRIISRSTDANADMRLKRAGAHSVVMPDRIGGTRMAKLVSRPDIVEFVDTILLQTSKEVCLSPIFCTNISSDFENKSFRELNIRNKTGANIVGVKDETGKFHFNPSADFILTKHLKLFVLANPDQLKSLKQLLLDI